MSRVLAAGAAVSRGRQALVVAGVGGMSGLVAALTHLWLGMPADQGLYLSGLPLPLSAARDVSAVLHGQGAALVAGAGLLLASRVACLALVARVAAAGVRLGVLLVAAVASYLPGFGALLLGITGHAQLAGLLLAVTAGCWMTSATVVIGGSVLPSLAAGTVAAIALAAMTPVGGGGGITDALAASALAGAEGAMALALGLWLLPRRRARG